MEKEKKTSENKNKILLWLCILIFGGVGVYCTFFAGNTSKYDSETKAYRIDENEKSDSDGSTYYPIYYYKVDGKDYQCESKSGSSARPKESKNKVYYDSKNPKQCLTQYEKSSSRTMGIIFLIVTVVIIVLMFRKPAVVSDAPVPNEEIDPEKQRQIQESIEKATVVIEKVSLIIKRVILGIIIFVLLLMIIFDSLLLKQTIVSKDYIETTATYVEETDSEDSIFDEYIYTFEDKKGNQQEIVVSVAKEETPADKITIKYNEKDPQDYYEEGSTLNTSGLIWFGVKVVVMVLLILLFFNKKLLNKIHLSVGRS